MENQNNAATEVTNSKRSITTYSIRDGRKKYETSARTLKEFKDEFGLSICLDTDKVTIAGAGAVADENDYLPLMVETASGPSRDLLLFVTPKANHKGGASRKNHRKELYSLINILLRYSGINSRILFDGANYTQLSNEEIIRNLRQKWGTISTITAGRLSPSDKAVCLEVLFGENTTQQSSDNTNCSCESNVPNVARGILNKVAMHLHAALEALENAGVGTTKNAYDNMSEADLRRLAKRL